MTLVYWLQPSSVVLAFKTAPLAQGLPVSKGPSPSCVYCIQNSDISIRIKSLYGSQTSPVDLWMQNSVLRSRMTLVYWSQPSFVVWCIQNRHFSIRITSLYGSQTSPVDLWMQNSVLRSRMTFVYWPQPSSGVLCIESSDFSIRITSLYGSQHSFVAFENKTALLGPE